MNGKQNFNTLSGKTEVSLRSVFWHLLRQWKLVIIFALAVGCLASAALQFRAMRRSQQAAQAPVLSPEENDAVRTVMLQEAAMADAAEYYENSALMRIDPYHCRILDLQFTLTGEEGQSGQEILNLCTAYKDRAESSDAIQALTDAGIISGDEKGAQDLIRRDEEDEDKVIVVADDGKEAGSGLFTVSIYLLPEMDESSIGSELEAFLQEKTQELGSRFGDHKIELTSSDEKEQADLDLASRKNELLQTIANYRLSIRTSKTGFSEGQKMVYAELAGQEMPAAEAAPVSWFSKKYFAAGVFLGVILYALAIFFLLWRRKSIDSAGMLEMTGLRSFGEIDRFSGRGGLKFLTDSPLFFRLQHKGSAGADRQKEQTAEAVMATAEHGALEKVTFLLFSGEEESREILSEISKKLAASGIRSEVRLLDTEAGASGFDRELLEMKDVILGVTSDRTRMQDLDTLVMRCADYDVNVLGTVFIGC